VVEYLKAHRACELELYEINKNPYAATHAEQKIMLRDYNADFERAEKQVIAFKNAFGDVEDKQKAIEEQIKVKQAEEDYKTEQTKLAEQ
jgi:predicted  nucleic acid-binding Zn-ribbon protein